MMRVYATFLFIFISATHLLASEIKLIEANEAIKMVGNRNTIFVSADESSDFNKSHIIDSVNIYAKDIRYQDTNGTIECLPKFICPTESQLMLESKGIQENKTLIIYDSQNGILASGVGIFFELLGHNDIRVLNGGLEAIRALDPNQKIYSELTGEKKELIIELKNAQLNNDIKKSEELSTQLEGLVAKMDFLRPTLLITNGEEKQQNTTTYSVKKEKLNLEHIVSKQEIRDVIKQGTRGDLNNTAVILDVRSSFEYEICHIPYAKSIEASAFSNLIEHLSFKTIEQIEHLMELYQITKEDTIYVYANYSSGRGAYVTLALRASGYKNAKLLPSGWTKWCDFNTIR